MPSARSFAPLVNPPLKGQAPAQRWYGFPFVPAALRRARSVGRHLNRSLDRPRLPTISCTTSPWPPIRSPTFSRSRSARRQALTRHLPPVFAFLPYRTIRLRHLPPPLSHRRHYPSHTIGSRPRPDNGLSSRRCPPSTVTSSGGPANRRFIPSSRFGSQGRPRRGRATVATRRRNAVVGTWIVLDLLRMRTRPGLQTTHPQAPSLAILHSECRMCARRALHQVRRMRAPPAAGYRNHNE